MMGQGRGSELKTGTVPAGVSITGSFRGRTSSKPHDFRMIVQRKSGLRHDVTDSQENTVEHGVSLKRYGVTAYLEWNTV